MSVHQKVMMHDQNKVTVAFLSLIVGFPFAGAAGGVPTNSTTADFTFWCRLRFGVHGGVVCNCGCRCFT